MYFKKIMASFDGSVDSKKALKVAERITKNHDAQLTVVYVYESTIEDSNPMLLSAEANPNLLQSQIYNRSSFTEMDEPTRSQEVDSMNKLNEKAEDTLHAARNVIDELINVEYVILKGNPKSELNKFAENNDIDLIVVGKSGISGIGKLLLGSVSEHVMKKADCSVLVVK